MMKIGKTMGKLWVGLAIIVLSALILLIQTTDVEGTSYEDKLLDEDDYHSYPLYGYDNDNWTLKFDLLNGSNIDLYILKSDEKTNYLNDNPFYVMIARENISSLDLKWTQPDDETYYIIVDNRNNSRSTDTLPEGNVSYDLEYFHYVFPRHVGIGSVFKNVVIREGEAVYDFLSFFGNKGTEFEIKIQVTNNMPVDLYILSDAEFNNYKNNEEFSPAFTREKILNYDDIWIQPDDQSYIFIVDNRDNHRSTDAIPTGNVTCNIESKNKSLEEDVENFIQALGIACVGCGALIIIVIVVIIWLIVRNKKTDTVVIQGPAGYPPGSPPQYPPMQPPQYQQQYPPQQPPQYQQQQNQQQQPPQNQQPQYQPQQPPQNQQPLYQPQQPPQNQQKPPQD